MLFTNGPDLFDNTYHRYLLKTFRDRLAFNDVPIKLYLRAKHREDRSALEEREETTVEEDAGPGSHRGARRSGQTASQTGPVGTVGQRVNRSCGLIQCGDTCEAS